MRPKLLWTRVLAVLLLVGCADAAAPNLFGPLEPEFAIVPSVMPNGQFSAAGSSVIVKGFNPVNPHNGDAIVATFFWSGSVTITSVVDRETNGRAVGNTYNLVESASSGGIHMATYIAFNAQNFPDGFDERTRAGDSVLVVQANMSGPITAGGTMITAWSGVQPTLSQGLGAHSSGSGSSTTQTMADPGTIAVNPGALVYAVTMGDQVVGMDPPPPPFSNVSNQSDPASTIKGDAESMVQGGSAGSSHPTWVWGFNSSSPRTWLATVIALNEAPTSTTGNLTVSASTTGSNLDPDGYTVTVDGGANQAVATNGSVTFAGLTAGSHSVVLSGVAANCTVSGGNTQTVNVPAGGTASTTFAVSCSATTGNLTVSTSTTGSSLDPDGYTVTVDGGSPQSIGINASVSYTNLSAGNHTVAISGVAGNCSVSGGTSRTVNVPSGGTGSTTFSVSCSTPSGNLTVSTSTTGSSLDPDGYTATVDGATSQAVATNGSVTFTGLSAGSHSVVLSGVAGNCSVSGGNTQTVNVPSGGTASTTFSVNCSATTGNLTVSTSTTGSNLDPDGYTVTVDGGASQAVATNGSVTFTGLSAGSHSVVLSGVAGNCSVSGGNTQTVNVPSGGTASTTFSVNCSATTGNLTVSTSTTGSNLDPDGYTVTVDGGASQAVATNGSVTFTGLSAGSHGVVLSGVAGNCTVSGGNTQTVNVPSGGTASTTFAVSCSATTGNLTVSTSTTGSSLDPDGYTVKVDGGSPQSIGINASVSYTNLSAGNHTVAISGVAGNCSVSGGTSRTVNVPSGGTASTTFSVTCSTPSGNLTVSTSTTGSSLDPDGYTVTVDGGSPQSIGINASVSYTNLSAGNHTVAISGVAGNCSVSGGTSRTVNVPSGGAASTTFSVSCSTPSGNLTVSTSTTG